MAGLSNPLEADVLESIFKQTDISAPAALYISLHTGDPETGTNEISGGAYARKQHDPDANNSTNTNWNAVATDGTAQKITNRTDITFTAASADWNSGNAITHFGIYTLSSGGVLLASGTINSGNGVVVTNGTQLIFPGSTSGDGNLKLTID